jgi:lysophospholipase L1-like esterase
MGAILLVLGFAEGVLRATKYLDRKYDHLFSQVNSLVIPSDNNQIGYTLKLGFQGALIPRHHEEPGVVYHINSLGLRGEEPQQKSNMRKIIVVGDSMTFGLGLEEHEVYPYLLKQNLNAWASQNNSAVYYEVYNCGVPGYNAEQEYHFGKMMVAQIQPDMILWQYYFNDSFGPMHYALGNLIWEFEQTFPSHLMFLVNTVLHKQKDPREIIGYAGVRKALQGMSKVTSDASVTFVTFIVPSALQIEQTTKEDYPIEQEILRNASGVYIDVISAFEGMTKHDVMVRENDDHLNALGHQILADALAEFLIRHLS